MGQRPAASALTAYRQLRVTTGPSVLLTKADHSTNRAPAPPLSLNGALTAACDKEAPAGLQTVGTWGELIPRPGGRRGVLGASCRLRLSPPPPLPLLYIALVVG